MVELFLLEAGAFDHFGDDSRDVRAGQLAVPFHYEQLGEFAFGLVHEEVLEF